MNNELSGKDMKRSSQVLILGTNNGIFQEGLKKTMNILNQDNQCPRKDCQLGIGYLEMSV